MSLYGGICLFTFTGIYVQSCRRPSLTGLIYLCTGIYVQKLWTSQTNWLDIFVYGDLCPKLRTPQPNWLDIFVYRDLRPKLWTSQTNRLDIFVWWTMYINTSNTYIVIYSDLLRRWTLHKFPHGQLTQVVDVRSLYPSTKSMAKQSTALMNNQ